MLRDLPSALLERIHQLAGLTGNARLTFSGTRAALARCGISLPR